MNPEPNPYAPPSVDPTRPSVSQDSGKLWRVLDGRLQVRNLASLPDVCVYGYPAEEPGTRESLVLQTTPGWVWHLLWLPAAAFMIWSDDPMGSWSMGIFFAVIFLPGLLAKKVRIMIFRSRRASRSLSFRILAGPLLIGLAMYMGFQSQLGWEWLPQRLRSELPWVAVLLAVFFWNLIPVKGPARVAAREDGWFEVKGTAPAAIARLAEIQQRSESMRRPA